MIPDPQDGSAYRGLLIGLAVVPALWVLLVLIALLIWSLT